MNLPASTTVPDILLWLSEDQDRVWELLSRWNIGCHEVWGEGIAEFIVGGLVTGDLAVAAKTAAEGDW